MAKKQKAPAGFKKILIANRGEIACRVMRTAKAMGIETVAVCSQIDLDAPHVRMADEHVVIGPPAAAQSYLKADKILAAMKKTGAQAVHPGYGFLSENTDFARAVEKAGLVFIGPGPKAIAAMGDKIESKKLAAKAGVSTIPGHMGVIKDSDEAVKIARDIGYPVMVKASAGGGGKGMRVARSDDEVHEGFRSATNEAKSSFGDDRIFIEKFIENPRHIEIQVLADAHGNCIYLGERECSLQRRHQKVIEEAPSPFIDAATRKAMGEQAVALAQAVDYRSAGTVEFVVDAERNFYFLEMNTRLQVEHPVTEIITGLDLVEQMLRVAWGEKLPLAQKDVKLKGWAIEARVYAEDPFRNFLPSIGRLVRYDEPCGIDDDENGLRVDSGVTEGSEISIYYDPMIAKLVASGKDRNQAIERMRGALDDFYIRGPSNNLSFLAALMAHPSFVSGNVTTNFIGDTYPDGFHPADVPPDDPGFLAAVGAFVHRRVVERETTTSGQMPGHEVQAADDWVVLLDRDPHPVRLTPPKDGYDVSVAGAKTYKLASDWEPGMSHFRAHLAEKPVCVQVDRDGVGYRLFHDGGLSHVLALTPVAAALYAHMPEPKLADSANALLSPMPGLLVSVAVEVGQEVRGGEELAVVEAMKMENVLRAERDAVIASIEAEPGDGLEVDQTILTFE